MTQPAGAFVQSYSDDTDGFIVGLDANDDLRWATFVGDTAYDALRSIRIANDRLIAVGYTYSPDYQPIFDGGASAFDQDSLLGLSDITVAEFDLDGALQWGTFVGSPGGDVLEANEPLALNLEGDVYLIGTSNGQNFPGVPDSGWVSIEPSPAWLLSFAHEDRSLQWSTPIAGHGPFDPVSIIADRNHEQQQPRKRSCQLVETCGIRRKERRGECHGGGGHTEHCDEQVAKYTGEIAAKVSFRHCEDDMCAKHEANFYLQNVSFRKSQESDRTVQH